MKPFEYVKDEAVRFFLRYDSALYMDRWLQDKREKEKIDFWFTKFWKNYSVNPNFSSIVSLLSWIHLSMYKALLYLNWWRIRRLRNVFTKLWGNSALRTVIRPKLEGMWIGFCDDKLRFYTWKIVESKSAQNQLVRNFLGTVKRTSEGCSIK